MSLYIYIYRSNAPKGRKGFKETVVLPESSKVK